MKINKIAIINAIEQRVKSAKTEKYSIWTIGITDDPKRRKTEHGNPEFWMEWEADTEDIAREVEKYFVDKGMKGDTGGPGHPHHVYIF